METLSFEMIPFVPFLTACIFALLLLILPAFFRAYPGRFFNKYPVHVFTFIVLTGLVYALIYSVGIIYYYLSAAGPEQSSIIGQYLYGAVIMDSFSLWLQILILFCAALTVLLSHRMLITEKLPSAPYYALILLSAAGGMVMTFAYDLLVVFLGLELLSIPLYVLCGTRKKDARALEASLKYLLMGAFASAFLVYGIALVFAATGTTKIPELFAQFISRGSPQGSVLLYAGIAFLTAGFAFKIALVPFHTWVPDVYEGAPLPITGFMATAVKTAGFAPVLRVFLHGFAGLSHDFFIPVMTLSLLTMTVANVVALFQDNVKRMLAYSSISHAGTLLLGFLCTQQSGLPPMMFYLLAYSFATVGSFAFLCALAGNEKTHFSDFSGKASASPFFALCAVTFMFSLTGLPPTAGFVGKLLIFSSLVKSDLTPLAVIALINSVISAFYYMRLPVMLYMQNGSHTHQPSGEHVSLPPQGIAAPPSVSRGITLAAWFCLASTLLFGVFMSPLVSFFEKSIYFFRLH